MIEVLKNVKPFLQPSPARNPGGDCFACTLKAIVDHFYPENPISFNDAWEAFQTKSSGGTDCLYNCWGGFESAVWNLRGKHDYDVEVKVDIVMPRVDTRHHSHAWGFEVSEWDWAYRLEAWLSAGWIPAIEMNFAGEGPHNTQGLKNHTDHFALIDGVQHYWKKHDTMPSSSLEHNVHVVCSARGAYWIDASDLIRKHGVNAWTLIRRDRRRDDA